MDGDMKGPTEKHAVIVHVTFLKVGEVNTLKETFEADVLLRTKWREPQLDLPNNKELLDVNLKSLWNPEVYIDNVNSEARVTCSLQVDHDEGGHAYVTERRRVKGVFVETMELWEFPFDIQDLSVTIMSEKAITEVQLEEDPEEIHKIYKQSFIDEQEWYLYKCVRSVQKQLLKDQADPGALRSALTVSCNVARRPAYFLWNAFSVTFLICCLAFVTFAVKPELPQNRLQLSFTLVLTAVAFKFVVNQSLPKISYLTYLDRYILCTLLVLAAVCLWHGLVTLFHPHSQWIGDVTAFTALLFVYTTYNAVFIGRIIMQPYKKRRAMSKLEKIYIDAVRSQAMKRNIIVNNGEKNARLTAVFV